MHTDLASTDLASIGWYKYPKPYHEYRAGYIMLLMYLLVVTMFDSLQVIWFSISAMDDGMSEHLSLHPWMYFMCCTTDFLKSSDRMFAG